MLLMKKRGSMKKLLFLSALLMFFIILNSNVVLSDFSKGNLSYSIIKTYSPGKNLKGWINISLENQPVNSVLNDNLGNSISLMDFLKSSNLKQDIDFFCIPKDCRRNFLAENPEKEKSFALNAGEKKVIGFKFTDIDLKEINSIRFNISSDASPSCKNQLKVYFFEDSSLVVMNNKSTSSVCEGDRNDGCFDETKSESELQEYYLDDVGSYCQRITIPESPKFTANAWLKSSGDDEITIRLYDENFNSKTSCSFSVGENFEGFDGCEMNYATSEKDYYLCLSSRENGITSIRGYKKADDEEGCGFYYSESINPEDYAFDFFVKGFQFDSVGTIEIKNNLDSEKTLSESLKEYISEKYNGNLNCTDTCVIPIVISSNSNQNITLKNLSINYKLEDGVLTKENNFYDLTEGLAQINSNGFLKISLDNANFTLPSIFGNYSYKLSLDDSEIFKDEIVIENVPEILSLSPLLTVSGFPTKLKVNVKLADNASIVNYKWNIDNVTKTTTSPELEYSFPGIKTAPGYRVEITVTDSNGKKSSKEFYVNVGTPRAVIEEKLLKMQDNLENITNQINNFPVFYQKSIKQQININELNEKLIELQKAYAQATTESDYYPIIEELLNLKVPESIVYGLTTGNINFYPSIDNIDLNIISEIAGGDYSIDKIDEYKQGVLEWNANYLTTKIKYTQINAQYEGYSENLVNVFELQIKELSSPEAVYYLFIRDLNTLFDKDYNEQESNGYYIIRLKPDNVIIFSISEDISFTELPVFISPSLDEIEILEIAPEEKKGIKWALFILLMLLLIFVSMIIYAVLQYWYKTKYETYLFKDRNYLFNLINYIHVQKEKGANEKEMIKKLKKQGWTSEQISYVLKKYLGKRTGMIEIIPVEKIINWFKGIKSIGKPGKPGKPVQGKAPQSPQTLPAKRFNLPASSRRRFFRGRF